MLSPSTELTGTRGTAGPTPLDVDLVHELDEASKKATASILIVDDQSVNLRVAEAFLLDDGYSDVVLCDRAERVLDLVSARCPDVILLDVMMPGICGLDVLAQLRSQPMTRHVPVIILTALTDEQTKSQALRLGATDFLNKPLDAYDLLPRVRNALVLRARERELEDRANLLEQIIRRRTAELTWTQIRIVHCLARAAERRDNETGRHAVRVGRYAQLLAEELGCNHAWCQQLFLAAMLHDVGKIGVADSILLKPGRLDPEELRQMREHCAYGKEIISPPWRDDVIRVLEHELGESPADSPLLELAASVAETHHERWDGGGYPKGLAGEQIPLEGRITAVADVFDALGSERPYKPAYPMETCREIILDSAGSHFDPAVVAAFESRFQSIRAVGNQLRD